MDMDRQTFKWDVGDQGILHKENNGSQVFNLFDGHTVKYVL